MGEFKKGVLLPPTTANNQLTNTQKCDSIIYIKRLQQVADSINHTKTTDATLDAQISTAAQVIVKQLSVPMQVYGLCNAHPYYAIIIASLEIKLKANKPDMSTSYVCIASCNVKL